MFVAQAPLVIVVVSDIRRSVRQYGEWGVRFFGIIGGAFAAMLVLLAAVDEGLGACFVGSFHDREVQRVLGLPPDVRPVGIIPVGYCAEGPEKFPRRPRRRSSTATGTGANSASWRSGVHYEVVERTVVVQAVYGLAQKRRQTNHLQGQV